MAKILYGISGEGFGHAARSKVVIEHLLAAGHELKILSYDRGYNLLKKHFEVVEIFGMTFTYSDNELKYVETFFKNFLKTPTAVRSIDNVSSIVDAFQPDWIISDFEPSSALVGNLKKIPVISIDNQHLLTRTKVNFPLRYAREAIAAMVVTRLFILKAKHYFITTFFEPPIIERNTTLVSPILRQEVLQLQPSLGDYFVVYLTSGAQNLLPILKEVPEARFVIYGLPQQGLDANLEFCPFDEAKFLQHLAGAKAVVANAGFSLISEALYLGKPYLAVPANKQFEQVLNAYYLEKMNYGAMLEELTEEGLRTFIGQLDDYYEQLALYPRQDNSYLFDQLDQLLVKKIKN
jgi:uncharacterized protein (TIGR00661 family)